VALHELEVAALYELEVAAVISSSTSGSSLKAQASTAG
jgi:hypothetical protein